MERKREVDGDVQSFVFRQHFASAGKVVHPYAAATVVVGVVVNIARWRIHAVGNACPLQPVASAFGESRVSAGHIFIFHLGVEAFVHLRLVVRTFHIFAHSNHFACDIAHSATDFHCIGGYNFALTPCGVAHSYHRNIRFPFLQREMSEINPCSAAHCLVHGEMIGIACAVHCVFHRFGAIGQCRIRNIHCIIAVGGDFGVPRCHRGFSGFFYRFHNSIATFGEWIFIDSILGAVVCKACTFPFSPLVITVFLRIAFYCIFSFRVDDDFHRFGVALAWTHHVCAGILQHRHEERHYITLCVQVFYGLEDARTLPLPAVEFCLEIPPVALPHCYVIAAKSFGYCRSTLGLDIVVRHDEMLFRTTRGSKRLLIYDILFNCIAFNLQNHFIARILFAERRQYLVFQSLHALLGKRYIGICLIQIYCYRFVL